MTARMSASLPTRVRKAVDIGIGKCSKVETVWWGRASAGLVKVRNRLRVAERLKGAMTGDEDSSGG